MLKSMVRLLYRRLLHAIDNHGVHGVIRRAVRRGVSQPGCLEAATERPVVLVHPFDLRYGTDTGGYLPGETLATGSSSDLYNTAYYGISPSTLEQAMAALPVDRGQYTFVDLGCGKGRALLVAAHAGFGKVVGVELAPELVAVALSNAQAHATIDVQIGDAATVVYPAGPLVVFFYHPFLAPLLRKVLLNLADQAHGREVFLLCANPVYPKVFQRLPAFRERWSAGFALSAEDAAADRHGTTVEPYRLWHLDATM